MSYAIDLSGKTAIVTGSTKGIGLSIAELLGEAGANVVISSRKADACEEVRRSLADKGHSVIAQPCNVGRKEELQALVDRTLAEFGGVDVVVANAATNPVFGPLETVPDDAWDKIMTTNLKGTFWLANMTIPTMIERGGGSFIVLSSIAGFQGNTAIGAYGISKAAEAALVRNLATEHGGSDVRVNAIAPGLVKTDFAQALWEDEKRHKRVCDATPLNRLGDPVDIGGVALFLASDLSRFVTGQTLVADGGITIADHLG